MKILLLGKNGQVGWELQRALAPLGELIMLDRQGSGELVGDLTNLNGLRQTVVDVKPDIIVNAAAYTAVDKAEVEQELATVINAEAPAALAQEAAKTGALLVHYSTDYVFDGSANRPWKESDDPAPLSHYGLSKLAGEQAIQASGCRHLLFRTSWVYASRGKNFLATMEKLIRERDSLNVVSNQQGTPTSAELIADVTAHAIIKACHNPSLDGLYHLTAAGTTSWQEYAAFIARWLEAHNAGPVLATPERIHPIATRDYPTPAQRPLNSAMDTTKLATAFQLCLSHWQTGVARVLAERNL